MKSPRLGCGWERELFGVHRLPITKVSEDVVGRWVAQVRWACGFRRTPPRGSNPRHFNAFPHCPTQMSHQNTPQLLYSIPTLLKPNVIPKLLQITLLHFHIAQPTCHTNTPQLLYCISTLPSPHVTPKPPPNTLHAHLAPSKCHTKTSPNYVTAFPPCPTTRIRALLAELDGPMPIEVALVRVKLKIYICHCKRILSPCFHSSAG